MMDDDYGDFDLCVDGGFDLYEAIDDALEMERDRLLAERRAFGDESDWLSPRDHERIDVNVRQSARKVSKK